MTDDNAPDIFLRLNRAFNVLKGNASGALRNGDWDLLREGMTTAMKILAEDSPNDAVPRKVVADRQKDAVVDALRKHPRAALLPEGICGDVFTETYEWDEDQPPVIFHICDNAPNHQGKEHQCYHGGSCGRMWPTPATLPVMTIRSGIVYDEDNKPVAKVAGWQNVSSAGI